jgi:uncharacterized protein YneF (UPF0154 family)
MKPIEFLLLLLIVIVGVFVALIAWTLIVKQQLTAQFAANPTATSIASLLTSL